MKSTVSGVFSMFEWSQMRIRKEALIGQHAKVLWMCGLSGSGKSTLAARLDEMLTERGYLSQVIDGDEVRSGLNRGLGFSMEDREENLRRVAELSKLFLNCGVITIVAFISPTNDSRQNARSIIGEDDFLEAFINAPLEICEQRDAKGLYKKVRAGEIRNFTGIDSPFEPPENPGIEIRTHMTDVENGTVRLLEYLLPYIEYKE